MTTTEQELCQRCGDDNLGEDRRCECDECSAGTEALVQCLRCGAYGHYPRPGTRSRP